MSSCQMCHLHSSQGKSQTEWLAGKVTNYKKNTFSVYNSSQWWVQRAKKASHLSCLSDMKHIGWAGAEWSIAIIQMQLDFEWWAIPKAAHWGQSREDCCQGSSILKGEHLFPLFKIFWRLQSHHFDLQLPIKGLISPTAKCVAVKSFSFLLWNLSLSQCRWRSPTAELTSHMLPPQCLQQHYMYLHSGVTCDSIYLLNSSRNWVCVGWSWMSSNVSCSICFYQRGRGAVYNNVCTQVWCVQRIQQQIASNGSNLHCSLIK